MDHFQGEGFMQDGVSYQRVSDEELTRLQAELKDQMNYQSREVFTQNIFR